MNFEFCFLYLYETKKKGKSSLERTVIDEKKIKYFTRTSQKNNKTSDQKSNLK
jgi:hypothetical protein